MMPAFIGVFEMIEVLENIEEIKSLLPGIIVLDSPNPDTARPEWLEFRRRALGGSDIAAVLGLSPWSTPLEIWGEKTGLIRREREDHIRLRMGNFLEDFIAAEFHRETGLIAVRCHKALQNPAAPHIAVNLDFLVFETGTVEPVGLLECKTTTVGALWDDGVPVNYQAQAQAQMHATGQGLCFFGVLMFQAFGPPKFEVVELLRDESDIELIVDQTGNFWRSFIETCEMPTPDFGQSPAEISRILGDAKTKVIVDLADNDLAAVAGSAFVHANEQIKHFEQVKKESQMLVMLAIGENAGALLPCGTRLSYVRPRRVDDAEAFERLGDQAAEYEKTTTSLDTPRFKKDHKKLYEEIARVSSGHLRVSAPKK